MLLPGIAWRHLQHHGFGPVCIRMGKNLEQRYKGRKKMLLKYVVVQTIYRIHSFICMEWTRHGKHGSLTITVYPALVKDQGPIVRVSEKNCW